MSVMGSSEVISVDSTLVSIGDFDLIFRLELSWGLQTTKEHQTKNDAAKCCFIREKFHELT